MNAFIEAVASPMCLFLSNVSSLVFQQLFRGQQQTPNGAAAAAAAAQQLQLVQQQQYLAATQQQQLAGLAAAPAAATFPPHAAPPYIINPQEPYVIAGDYLNPISSNLIKFSTYKNVCYFAGHTIYFGGQIK